MKIKLMKYPYLLAIIILISIISLSIFIKKVGKIDMLLKRKYGHLLTVTYSNSGDMNGNIDSITLDTNKKTIIKRYAVMHSDPIETKEYKITDEDIENVNEIIEKYKLQNLSKLPMGDLFAYDAPTKTLTFIYDNSKIGGSSYESYNINYYMKLSKKDINHLNELTNYLSKLLKEDKLIKSYEE